MKSHIGKSLLAATLATSLAVASSAYAVGANGATAYGQPVPTTQAEDVISINPDMKYVNVRENDVVKFVDAGTGQSFAWVFELPAPENFQLSEIAPAGFPVGNTRVYVSDVRPH